MTIPYFDIGNMPGQMQTSFQPELARQPEQIDPLRPLAENREMEGGSVKAMKRPQQPFKTFLRHEPAHT